MAACKTQLVRDAAEVPPGFALVSEITVNMRERQAIYDAHKKEQIEARKRMVTPSDRGGRLWVRIDDAVAVVRGYRERMARRTSLQRVCALQPDQPAVVKVTTSSAPAGHSDAAVTAIYQLAEEVRNLRRVLQAVGRAGVDEVGA